MLGIANPASEFCIRQGGILDIVKDQDGNEIGMCKLPDGTVIEEWELFRSQQDKPTSTQRDSQGAIDGDVSTSKRE